MRRPEGSREARGLFIRIFRNYSRWWWGVNRNPKTGHHFFDLGPISVSFAW